MVFTLQPPECYMEIRSGYGVSGARISGPVRVGDPLTLLIYMRSAYGEYLNLLISDFDLRMFTNIFITLPYT